MGYTLEPNVVNAHAPKAGANHAALDTIVYIVSEKLDYSLLICPDAGPAYANSFGWRHDTFDSISAYFNTGKKLFIDTRLSEEEYETLYGYIAANSSTEFVLTVTDPCFEQCVDKPLYKLLFRCVHLKNVRFLSRYQPTELVQFLSALAGEERMLTLHYPYILNKEIEIKRKKRHRILLSGALGHTVYPERYLFWKSVYRSFWRLKIDFLAHPGYPDVGMSLSHTLYNDAYIEHLSSYQFMFIGPSRCDLELLKYTECAYAGCVPVGKSPASFDQHLAPYVQPIDLRNISKSLLRIFSIPKAELRDIATGYREELKRQRLPEVLNLKVTEFLQQT